MNESTNSTNDTNLEGVMRRVKKLLAIAEDGRANAEEASAAAGMAERIMRKYQIEHADVLSVELARGGAELFKSADVGSSLNPEGRSEQASGWAGILAVSVAELHDCQARYATTSKHGKTLRFQGYASDVQMAKFTYLYLVNAMAAESRAFARDNEGVTRKDSEAFRRGFSSAVNSALRKAWREKGKAMQAAASSRALVVAKDSAVAAHFGAIKYTTRRAGHSTSGQAFSDGFARGQKVDVGRCAVGGGSGNPLLG